MGQRTNFALELLLLIALGTGALGYLSGGSGTKWVLVVHGTAGISILVLAPWKALIVREGLHHHHRDSPVSIALAIVVVLIVATGLLHSTGLWQGRGLRSPLGVHLVAAVAAVPLFLWHVTHRRLDRPRADLSRRTVLRGAGVIGGALLFRTVTRDDSLRFTGSAEVSSFDPDGMPVIQWFNDDRPTLSRDQWRLRVGDDELTYAELVEFSDELTATLDCTGGWFSTQEWRGVTLRRLLGPDAGGRSIVVRSATGFSRRFPAGDADRLLLASHLGGEPLSPGHGFPARLVAPGRRGMWWVKWVTEIQPGDRPWWLQSPIPLS